MARLLPFVFVGLAVVGSSHIIPQQPGVFPRQAVTNSTGAPQTPSATASPTKTSSSSIPTITNSASLNSFGNVPGSCPTSYAPDFPIETIEFTSQGQQCNAQFKDGRYWYFKDSCLREFCYQQWTTLVRSYASRSTQQWVTTTYTGRSEFFGSGDQSTVVTSISLFTTINSWVIPDQGAINMTAPCCGSCTLAAATVDLYYWPSGTAAPTPSVTGLLPNQTAVVNALPAEGAGSYVDEAGFTFVSPSIYIGFTSLSAHDACGVVGTPLYNTTMAFDPTEISSVEPYQQTYTCTSFITDAKGNSITMTNHETQWITRPLTYSDVAQNCSSISGYYWFSDDPLGAKAGDPCHPLLAIPTRVKELQKEWNNCMTDYVGGFYDPPKTLKQGPMLVPTTADPKPTADPGQSPNTGAPKTTAPPALPEETPEPKPSTQNGPVPASSSNPPVDPPAPAQPKTSAQADPPSPPNKDPVGSNPPAQPNPLPQGSSTTIVLNPQPADPSTVAQVPSNPSAPALPVITLNPNPKPNDPANPNPPNDPPKPSSAPALTLIPTVIPVNPNPVSPANPVDPAPPANPANPVNPAQPIQPTQPANPAQPVDPAKPVDPATPTNPSPPGNPGVPAVPAAPVNPPPSQPSTTALLIGSQTLLPGSTLTVGGSTSTLPNGIPTVTGGTELVLDPQGTAVIVDRTSTMSLPPAAPAQPTAATAPVQPAAPVVIPIGTQIITALPSAPIVVGTQTLSPGSTLLVDGTTLSLQVAPSGSALVVGQSTIPLTAQPAPTAGPMVVTLPGTTLTANSNTQFVIGSQTLTPGGSVTDKGTTYVLSTDGVGRTVFVAGTGGASSVAALATSIGGGKNGTASASATEKYSTSGSGNAASTGSVGSNTGDGGSATSTQSAPAQNSNAASVRRGNWALGALVVIGASLVGIA